MDTTLLRTFVKASELKNFFKVSQELGYAPSTITSQIKNLEKELGYPLFDRVDNKVKLTAYGDAFIPYAKQVLNLVEESKNLYKNSRTPEGSIHLGAIGSVVNSYLERGLTAFSKRYPKIHLNIREGNSMPLFEMLKLGDCDLVICINDSFRDPDFKLVAQRPVRLVFFASNSSELAGNRTYSLKEILSQPLILSEYRGIYRRRLDALAQKQHLSVDPLIGVEDIHLIMELVAKGLGVTFLPEYCLLHNKDSDKLSILDVDAELPKLNLQVCYNQKKWVSPALEALISFIEQGDFLTGLSSSTSSETLP